MNTPTAIPHGKLAHRNNHNEGEHCTPDVQTPDSLSHGHKHGNVLCPDDLDDGMPQPKPMPAQPSEGNRPITIGSMSMDLYLRR